MRAAASASAMSGLNCVYSSAICNCRALHITETTLCACHGDPNVQCSWGGDKIGCTYVNFTCDEPADCPTTSTSSYVCRHVGTSEMRFKFIDDNDTPCDNIITCTNVTTKPTAPPKPTKKTGKSGTYVVV